MVKIAVLGAGIIGVTACKYIQDAFPNMEITLISENFSPNTTGDGAAGIWMPYLLENTPEDLINEWANATHDFFSEKWNAGLGWNLGISLLPVYLVNSLNNTADPSWKNIVYGFRKMTNDELIRFNKPSLRKGYSFTTFTAEARRLIPYFMDMFTKSGGKIIKKSINNLMTLGDEFDIVVNCTGIGAKKLASDELMFPIRGQVIRVHAPGIFYGILDDDEDGRYIIPNQNSVILGGTHQVNDWNLTPNDIDTKFILDGCSKFIPSLKNASVISQFVGLRPGRKGVRLEIERISLPGSAKKQFHVIHNYGHGGSGITLCIGCAISTVKLVEQCLRI